MHNNFFKLSKLHGVQWYRFNFQAGPFTILQKLMLSCLSFQRLRSLLEIWYAIIKHYSFRSIQSEDQYLLSFDGKTTIFTKLNSWGLKTHICDESNVTSRPQVIVVNCYGCPKKFCQKVIKRGFFFNKFLN